MRKNPKGGISVGKKKSKKNKNNKNKKNAAAVNKAPVKNASVEPEEAIEAADIEAAEIEIASEPVLAEAAPEMAEDAVKATTGSDLYISFAISVLCIYLAITLITPCVVITGHQLLSPIKL